MAKISLNDAGKALEGPVTITLADVSFPLADGNASYETDSHVVIDNAKAHPYLTVEQTEEERAAPIVPEPAPPVPEPQPEAAPEPQPEAAPVAPDPESVYPNFSTRGDSE